jgi:AcrR family transcriptional regulator
MSGVAAPLFSDAVDEVSPGKRELTKAQNRDAILKAARAVFSELGYEAASVRDIIRRTGLASGTFYNYYRSKEEVAKALHADVVQRLRPILRAEREQAADFESYLGGALRAYFSFLIDELEIWGPGLPRAERLPYLRVQTPVQGAVFEEIQSSINLAIEHGLAPRVDAEYLTSALIGVSQMVGDKMLHRKPFDSDAAARFVVELVMRGLGSVPMRDPA